MIDNEAMERTQEMGEHMLDPEAPASPESVALTHEALTALIDAVPDEFVWNTQPTRGAGDNAVPLKTIRFMSQPAHITENGQARGESFMWVSWIDDESEASHIMVTEDKGSGNPLGDVLGSLEAGAIVRKISRTDTVFSNEAQAVARLGNFTFGPAQLEREQNAMQANNPFVVASQEQVDRVGELLANGDIYAHDANMNVPPDSELQTMSVAAILLNR